MGGNVNALDIRTGEIKWTWTRGSAGIDSPYGVYELFGYRTHAIADGKLFLQEGVQYSPPLHPGRRVVLDCETGKLVWDILSYSSRAGSIIADGCLQEWDSYDCKIYTFGRGPTQTTVTAPDSCVTVGSSITIRGTVMAISAGAQQDGVVERFPAGLPAVSDASMINWMEYVYKQQTKPTNTTGVEVRLSAEDSTGNIIELGTTTSDDNGFFSFSWKPTSADKYTLTASFDGSESYWPSEAVTAFTADAAGINPIVTPHSTSGNTGAPTVSPSGTGVPISSPSTAIEPGTGTSTETLLIVAAAVIIVAVVAAVAVLLRRRK
jgi:hypothetical protein